MVDSARAVDELVNTTAPEGTDSTPVGAQIRATQCRTDAKAALVAAGLWHEAALIDGQWLQSTPFGQYDLRDPASGDLLCRLPNCGADETTAAVESAARAQVEWRQANARHRSEIVRRWYDLIVENKEHLALLITLEEGKPLHEARGEIDYAASFVQWFAEEAKRVNGEVIPAPKDQQRIIALKQPVGVCAAITPWNFPAAMITRKAAPALAAGCTMVVKPAFQTPMTALALGELALRAGVPAGALNIVIGRDARTIGHVLTSHDLVRKITFTGSTEVGRVLLEQSARTVAQRHRS